MNKTIYCFTSTGNSLYVAKKIANEIGAQVSPILPKTTVTDDEVIGIVYPVFFVGAPNIVSDFAKELTIQNPDAYIFVVVTYGGECIGGESALKGLLKGEKIAYANAVKMAENYTPIYKMESYGQRHAKAEEKISKIICDIKARKKRLGGLYTLINQIIHTAFPGKDPACDKKFRVSDQCTSCGLCAKICPVDNITVTDGKPQFAHRCQHCIACLHICPESAINYGKSDGKAHYVHPEIGVKGLLDFWGEAKR